MAFPQLCDLIISEVRKHRSKSNNPFLDSVIERTELLRQTDVQLLLTSVTRVVDQKVRLLLEKDSHGIVAFDRILETVTANNGLYAMLGTGTAEYEMKMKEYSLKHERFLFINCYSEPVARALYANGAIFLMPSSFEPCGISQMIAMRDGQPCIVNAVGGLKDTVIDGVDGFQFSGRTLEEQVDNFVAVTRKAVELCLTDADSWKQIRAAAARARFTWEKSAQQYIQLLYT
jgi:starch synthase